MTFIESCVSILDLLKKPDIGPALLELRKVTDTKLGNLLGFMHAFNLRFGPAKTPRQRQNYQILYQLLDQTRDVVLAEANQASSPVASANTTHATDFLQTMEHTRLHSAPAPRAPDAKKAQ
jgi:hypothetical protein